MGIPRDGLVAEYLFNGEARDSSGHGSHGNVIGATLTADRFGNPDSAYAFDGKNDYVIVTPPPKLSSEALTLSVWVRYNESAFKGWNSAIVSQDNGDEFWRSYAQHRRILQLSASERQITWHRMGWGNDDAKARRPFQIGAWNHVAAVVDGKTHHLYVDGVLNDTKESWFASNPAEPLYIGRKAPPDKRMFFNGCIDDVRLYNRALTAAEVETLFRENGWSSSPAEEYTPKPEPVSWQGDKWTSLDIDTLVQGYSVPQDDQLTLKAGGIDIWGRRDGFRFVYQKVKGDFAATVILTDLQNTSDWNAWAKAGMMVRQSLQNDAPHVYVLGTANVEISSLSKQWRAEAGGETRETRGSGWKNHGEPVHLKLVRKGDTVHAFSSTDGETWTAIGEPTAVGLGGGDVYLGLAATPRSFGNLGEAKFTGWQLTRA